MEINSIDIINVNDCINKIIASKEAKQALTKLLGNSGKIVYALTRASDKLKPFVTLVVNEEKELVTAMQKAAKQAEDNSESNDHILKQFNEDRKELYDKIHIVELYQLNKEWSDIIVDYIEGDNTTKALYNYLTKLPVEDKDEKVE